MMFSRIFGGMLRMAVGALLGTALCLFDATPAFAIGTEGTTNSDDLTITVDSRWAGGTDGGYFPVRVQLMNRGEPKTLTFRFSALAVGQSIPVVRRRVLAEQNATVRFTLPIPIVSTENYGSLQVFDGSKELKNHQRQIQLPDVRFNLRYGSTPANLPAIVAVSNTPVDFARFEAGLQSQISMTPGTYGGSVSADCAYVPANSLPESWIDYTAVDLFAIPFETLASIPSTTRTALLGWVHCGGTLVVTNCPAAKREELSRLVAFDKHADADAEWTPARPSDRKRVPVPQFDRFGNPIRVVVPGAPGMPMPAPETPSENPKPVEENFVWTASPETFAARRLMLGRVIAFAENPFPGSSHDWAWFLNSLKDQKITWKDRHGFSARRDNSEFLEFLNPGVRGVPTYAFLVLITMFAIAIGPVNYFLLAKRRRLYLLLLTIPAIAFVTSATLLAYSTLAHGFSVKSRLRSLTVLDQPARTAVTTSRLALYAGLAPSGGLKFSPETAVYPVWPSGSGFEAGSVDWTDTQNLATGWLLSRTHTQFVTMSHEAARGRLDVQAPVDGKLPISNGHEFDIEALLVSDDSGAVYFGNEIPAGAAVTLNKADDSSFSLLPTLLLRDTPQRPEGVDENPGMDLFSQMRRGPSHYMMFGTTPLSAFRNGQMETTIRELQTSIKSGGLKKRSYVAVLRENPGVATGLVHTTPQAGFHLILGYY